MSKGDYASMAKRQKTRKDSRRGVDEDQLHAFVGGADYQDKPTQEAKVVDRRRKPEHQKGKPVTFYLQEYYSAEMDKIVGRFKRSEGITRSDLVKVAVHLLQGMSDEEIAANVKAAREASSSR
jgi:hypothetical protein